MKVKPYKQITVFTVLKYIYLIINILLMLYPLFFMFLNAFKTSQEITVTPFAMPKGFTALIANFKMVWTGKITQYLKLTSYLTMLKNTVILTIGSMVIMLIVATLCSYALGRINFAYKSIIVIFILIAQTVPYFGYMYPMYFELYALNLIDKLGGTILVYVAVSLPSTIILMLGFFKTFPIAVEEAAMIDGCNEFTKFIFIVIPMSIGIIGSMAIVNFMGYWNEFAIVSMMQTSPKLRTINMGVFVLKTQMGGVGKKDYIMMLLTLSAIPNMLFFTIFQKSIVNGISLGSVKG